VPIIVASISKCESEERSFRTLEGVFAMVELPSDLQSPKDYIAAEAYWSVLLQQDDLRRQWRTPWLKQSADEFRDGNPIFSAWSPELRKAVRVIQYRSSPNAPDFACWLDQFGGAEKEASLRELVIACSLSKHAVMRAREMIREWVQPMPRTVVEEAPRQEIDSSRFDKPLAKDREALDTETDCRPRVPRTELAA
jgi:hypothetical protein